MSTSSSYQTFLVALGQLEQDQSLFESMVGEELVGLHHENLVRVGGKMCHKLKLFSELGEPFAATLSSDFVPKCTEAIQEYEALLMPPKVFGGLCPCLKTARDGPEYDRRFMVVMAKISAVVFLSQAVVIESKGERHNMSSMHFTDYANRLYTLHTALNINTKGSDKPGSDKTTRETAKGELLTQLEAVKRFMIAFEEDTGDFRGEYQRRVGQISELLTSPSVDGGPLSRRLLVKAQSGLQEIMNSAAMVSLRKAQQGLLDVEALTKELTTIHDAELAVLNEVGPRMQEFGYGDLLSSLRRDSETLFTDTSSKLRDAAKRWMGVRAQSQPRPVVEYHEEVVSQGHDNNLGGIIQIPAGFAAIPAGIVNNVSGGDLNSVDPEKLFRDTGKKIGDIGKKGAQAAQKAVNMFKGELMGTNNSLGQQPQPQQQNNRPYQPLPQQQQQQQQQQYQQQQYQQLPQQPPQYQLQPPPQQQYQPRPMQSNPAQAAPKSQNPLSGFFKNGL